MTRSTVRHCLLISAAAALLLPACGCVYQFGSSLPPGMRSIHVPPFANQCGEPTLENETTKAAIQEFQNDGTLEVTGPDSADLILAVTLENVSIDPIRYERDDAKAGREFRMRITAAVEVQRRVKGDALMRRTVAGETTFFLLGDMAQAKRTAMPLAAKDLAHNIVECVVEYW